jgi:hypothetical protein
MKQKGSIFNLVAILSLAAGMIILNHTTVKAQNPSLTPFQVIAGGPHTSCNIATGEYCLGTDGLWFSANGTSWAQIGAAAVVLPATLVSQAGVCITGYNATTGAWTTSPCVNTVNTKSGTATISATTTLQ